MTTRSLQPGTPVLFTDQHGVEHHALVTNAFGGMPLDEYMAKYGAPPCINVVYVSKDENKTDQYGRQLSRETSAIHVSHQPERAGMFWRWPDEA